MYGGCSIVIQAEIVLQYQLYKGGAKGNGENNYKKGFFLLFLCMDGVVMGYDSTRWLLLALHGMSLSKLTVASCVVLAESIWLIHTCGCPFMGVLCGWVGVSGVVQGYLFLGTPLLPLVFPWAWVCCVFLLRLCLCVVVSLGSWCVCAVCAGWVVFVSVLPLSLFPPLPPNRTERLN